MSKLITEVACAIYKESPLISLDTFSSLDWSELCSTEREPYFEQAQAAVNLVKAKLLSDGVEFAAHNIALRLWAIKNLKERLIVHGDQHPTFEDTLPDYL